MCPQPIPYVTHVERDEVSRQCNADHVGERRWRAAQRLGWTEIAAVIRTDLGEAARVRLALLENLVSAR